MLNHQRSIAHVCLMSLRAVLCLCCLLCKAMEHNLQKGVYMSIPVRSPHMMLGRYRPMKRQVISALALTSPCELLLMMLMMNDLCNLSCLGVGNVLLEVPFLPSHACSFNPPHPLQIKRVSFSLGRSYMESLVRASCRQSRVLRSGKPNQITAGSRAGSQKTGTSLNSGCIP